MVYMCGSDLESNYGAATRDINEIINAGFDTDYTNVIIMAGGSEQWANGFDVDKTNIC